MELKLLTEDRFLQAGFNQTLKITLLDPRPSVTNPTDQKASLYELTYRQNEILIIDLLYDMPCEVLLKMCDGYPTVVFLCDTKRGSFTRAGQKFLFISRHEALSDMWSIIKRWLHLKNAIPEMMVGNQKAIFRLLINGLSQNSISTILTINKKTVSGHKFCVFRRAGIKSINTHNLKMLKIYVSIACSTHKDRLNS